MSKELPKTYIPADCEDEIYKKWEESGFFNPDNLDLPEDAKPFTVILPPPNITDKLHMGHAAMLAIEDLLIRYHRMKGFRALWLPGTDHAAIATQNAVEKKILKENGQTRHDLGKEKFLEEVWKFLRETQAVILNQTRKMGSSLDWSREAFTLDEERKRAVKKMFIDMYQAGAIYQGERIVNWCPRCRSTLADDEVEYREEKTKLYWLKYGPFVLATTRPETKLGDTAVAVHPDDKRYKAMVGKEYDIDGVLGKFKIKVVADKAVDPEFGSGAIKVTPAHSFIDNEIAQRHNLPMKKIIDEDGKMMANCGKYAGLTTAQARETIVEDMKKLGLIDHIDEDYIHNTATCYRCGATIEPLLSKQWFVGVDKKLERLNGKSLKEKAIEVVKEEKIKFIPARFEKRYLNWMENLHDWCISRQIWFGHEIPAWRRTATVELVLVRHAQTDWNKNKIMQGQKDIPLNEKGKQQARELKELIRKEKIDAIIISPLQRTRQTAEIINTFGLPVIEDGRLKERSYGKFEGLKTEDLLKDHPEITTFKVGDSFYWIDVPTAETYGQLRARVREFLTEIKNRYAGKRVLIVSHGDTLDMFYAELNNIPNEEAYGKFSSNGHFYKNQLNTKELYVGEKTPEGKNWQPDADSLDTWFSSGMWTFSTLGWPDNFKDNEKIGDLARFHPTQVLETGYDILTLWVSRMIMLTLFALNEVPFKNVYLHGLVLDKNGKKMSKSKGNGIDPLDMIKKYGADATRLSLSISSSPGNDVRIFEEKIEGQRNFVNKLWNIARYIIENRKVIDRGEEDLKLSCDDLTLADTWILKKMKNLIEEVNIDLKNYNFSAAGERLKEFTRGDFADWYLEISKIEENEKTKNAVLKKILKDLLKLWHPFIPFVTEKIYSQIVPEKILLIENYPEAKDYSRLLSAEKKELADFEVVKNIISAVRSMRAGFKISPSQKIEVFIYSKEFEKALNFQKNLIQKLGTNIASLKISKAGEKLPQAFYEAIPGAEIYIPLKGVVDLDKEKHRLNSELQQSETFFVSLEKKLKNKKFIQNAPKEIVEKEKEKLSFQKNKISEIKKQLQNLE